MENTLNPVQMMGSLSERKTFFLYQLVKINREGCDKLTEWLLKSDFFTAPCSKDHHLNREGGLLEHSINVYNLFIEKNVRYDLGLSDDSVRICALLHDLCKANFYKFNKTTGKIYYDDKFPMGHGEKSVILIQHFMDLSPEECCIIRWHMAGFDLSPYAKGAYYTALKLYPACLALHTADYEASVFLEG